MSDRYRRAYRAVARSGVIAIAFALSALGQAQADSNQNRPNGAQAHAADNQRGSEALPVVVNIQGAETPQDRANDHADDVLRHNADQAWTIGIGVFAILAAFAQVGALVWQIIYLRRTVYDSEEAIKAAQRSAKAAEDAVGKSDAILAHAQDSSQKELRAYVFPHVIVMKSRERPHGSDVWIRLEFRNAGKTPAKNVKIAAHAVQILQGEELDLAALPDLSHIGPLGPDEERMHAVEIEPKVLRDMRLEYRTWENHIFGRIEYEDEFSRDIRWTTFHAYLPADAKGQTFHTADTGNDYR